MMLRNLRISLIVGLTLWALAMLLAAPTAAAADAASERAPPAASTAPRGSTYEFYPRDVRALLPEKEWRELERQGRDPDEEIATAESVSVEDFRPAPNVPLGIASVFWGMRHPLQVWRIFAPIPP